MAHVTVTIAGRAYRMACGDGEEKHLENLGELVDAKIAELKGSFGEIGDQRITVMASLTFADELHEARSRIAALEGECESLRRSRDALSAEAEAHDGRISQRLTQAAGRIEQISHAHAAGGASRDAAPAPVGDHEGGPAS